MSMFLTDEIHTSNNLDHVLASKQGVIVLYTTLFLTVMNLTLQGEEDWLFMDQELSFRCF